MKGVSFDHLRREICFGKNCLSHQHSEKGKKVGKFTTFNDQHFISPNSARAEKWINNAATFPDGIEGRMLKI